MERVALTAEIRGAGKGIAKRLRVEGGVPAVLYGKSVKPLTITVNKKELSKAVKTKAGMNVLIDLAVQGGDSGLARIRDYQADPFKRDFTHVDFQAISLNEKIAVEVPIILVGASVGVKEGGVVEQLKRTIEVRSLPEKIPEKLEVDITELKIGDSIHADGLKLPDGVEFPQVFNYTIVTIVPPAKEEEAPAAPVVGEVPVEGAAPAEGAPTPAEGAPAAAAKVEEKKEGKKEGKEK